MTPERREREEQDAQDYAVLLLTRPQWPIDWQARNNDIIERFSLTALRRIKRRAWQIAALLEPGDG